MNRIVAIILAIVLSVASATAGIRHYCDYLCSTRAVVDTAGMLLQTMNYYPSGVPFSRMEQEAITDRLHTGKPFLDMNGLGYYDNNARFLDILTGSFISRDALAGSYPHLSPYAHCANNPLIYIDPDGNEIVSATENGREFNMRYGEVRAALRASNLAQQLDAIKASKDFKLTIKDAGNEKKSNYYDHKTKTIYIDLYNAVIHSEGVNSPLFMFRHELDHAYADMIDPESFLKRVNTEDTKYHNEEEKRVMTEGDVNAGIVLNEPVRTKYGQTIRESIEDPTSNKLDSDLVHRKQEEVIRMEAEIKTYR